MLLLLGALAAQAQDCADPSWIASQTEEHVLNYVLEDASAAFQRAEEAFACSGPAHPKVVARLLDADGTVALLQGRREDAAAAYATARSVAPDVWRTDYGDDARALWEAAFADGIGTIELTGMLGRLDMWVDGAQITAPAVVAVGPHLVQVGYKGEPPTFARWVSIHAGETTSLYVALSEPSTEPAVVSGTPMEAVTQPQKGRALLWTGVAMTATGAAVGTITWATNKDREEVPSTGYAVGMIATNVAGWTVAGVGVGLGVIGAVRVSKTAAIAPTGNGVMFHGRF